MHDNSTWLKFGKCYHCFDWQLITRDNGQINQILSAEQTHIFLAMVTTMTINRTNPCRQDFLRVPTWVMSFLVIKTEIGALANQSMGDGRAQIQIDNTAGGSHDCSTY
ncbi:hypothetical protein CEXT_589641 [Caerostris extrusa]|uniref:Uncharacterized protein n=1 Tax=Caerostris extrusa TaxID=172846 RepID=A0AAV4WI25_CAEEX|nr:hypothetical protein CEXT_589641 [Caerostris extrusa]